MWKRHEPETPRKLDVVGIQVLPGLDPATLETATASHKALVLIGYAMGSVPTNLNDKIRELTQRGIPVFIVSDNPGTDHGYAHVTDEVQLQNLAAGATRIEKANVNRLPEIVGAIQDEIDAGKSGAELAEAVRKKFAYGKGEKKSVREWDTAAGRRKILRDRRRTLRTAFGRGAK